MDTANGAESPANPTPIVLEGIVRQLCLNAFYNRTRMVLAPHILYMRGDALYVDAQIISRDFVIPREEKIGTFKLDGLKNLALTERSFTISKLFEREAEKYAAALMAVETASEAA
ncbi:hypothetical protein CA223_05695 [Sphingomonas koreensis]|jgi:hypothetical protein|uniref:WYL domain-containing protein n=1 Tax=Sphingomonas koreensis TaxID=93064 RepID=A0A1L6JBT6_9SPHN|nr:hypothetical protein [Sphingomonas koreensis]APR53401.1 hypothetical protein BRX40_14050 [Sphingomonas koreensis]MDC7809911.1 hypothetical protein [Sphingomonas koreensis]RSU24474.1 hypothetical protein CA224_01790 [Sphingomonas koreensis]RSU25119.1 hypothetical protein CA222_13380 [Sphingomonas koreensis]RSU30206.1 hypothetical protein CA225_05970 [Sphingomonas koreensis]